MRTIKEFDKEIYLQPSYGESEKQLRRMFNYYISYDHRDELLDKLMSKYFDEDKLCKEVYLDIAEIREISESGSVIGSHTVNHKVLSRLSFAEQEYEINQSFRFLNSNVGLKKFCFCYPLWV